MNKWYKVEDFGKAIQSVEYSGFMTVNDSNEIAKFIIDNFVTNNSIASKEDLFYVFIDMGFNEFYSSKVTDEVYRLFKWYFIPFSRIRRNIKRLTK